MTDELDIEALERLRAEATPGRWRCEVDPDTQEPRVYAPQPGNALREQLVCVVGYFDEPLETASATGRLIVAAVNALPLLIAAARERDALLAERAQLRAVLERNKRLHDEALPKFNWGASALDANAIGLLNEVPRETIAALQDAPDALLTGHGFDLATHLRRQKDFSERTFGPGQRTKGVVDHIRKELAEIEADPTDLMEWVDVIILAFDGAWRAGWEADEIVKAIVAKQTKNEARAWPDWRTADPEKAIEHVRAPCGENKAQ